MINIEDLGTNTRDTLGCRALSSTLFHGHHPPLSKFDGQASDPTTPPFWLLDLAGGRSGMPTTMVVEVSEEVVPCAGLSLPSPVGDGADDGGGRSLLCPVTIDLTGGSG